jgi:hypothetical protein
MNRMVGNKSPEKLFDEWDWIALIANPTRLHATQDEPRTNKVVHAPAGVLIVLKGWE